MKNKIGLFLLALAFVGVAIFEGLPARFSNWVKADKNFIGLMSKVALPESLSGPLRGPQNTTDANLTEQGVIDETNKQRDLYHQTALHTNTKLNLAAKVKLDDMFRQQYFEHISPDGKHPSDIIKASGYAYLVVGENLALGNYQNDQVLVEAWMNSAGHRANILDSKFEEIGVAVGEGMLEGKQIWLAVQEFGAPLSSCPSTSTYLKTEIEQNRQKIQTQETELKALKAEIDSGNSQSSTYQQNVAEYNAKVAALNQLIESTKVLVNEYNKQVNLFNQCLEQ